VSGTNVFFANANDGFYILDGSRIVSNRVYYIPRNEYIIIGNFTTSDFNPLTTQLFSGQTFEDMYGTPGEDWCISWWDNANQVYQRFGEDGNPPDMACGHGYWFIQDISDNFSFPFPGDVNTSDVTVTLNPALEEGGRGYTMVANPFNGYWDLRAIGFRGEDGGDIALGALEAAGAIDMNLHQYDGVDYAPRNLQEFHDMVRGDGGWMVAVKTPGQLQAEFSSSRVDMVMQFDDLQDTGDNPVQYKGWELNLTAASSDNQHVTYYNTLGVRDNAKDQWDCWDAVEMTPHKSEYVQIYFDHAEYEHAPGKYTYDYRNINFADAKTWDFKVEVMNVPNTKFILDWNNIDGVPAEYSLVLRDVDNDVIIGDMCEVRQLPFESGDSNLKRNFQVIATCNSGENATLPQEFGIHSAYPNPFNNTVRIGYRLMEAADVSLKVFDMQGREVVTLSSEEVGAGVYTTNWNAGEVTSGVYIIQLSNGGDISSRKVILMK